MHSNASFKVNINQRESPLTPTLVSGSSKWEQFIMSGSRKCQKIYHRGRREDKGDEEGRDSKVSVEAHFLNKYIKKVVSKAHSSSFTGRWLLTEKSLQRNKDISTNTIFPIKTEQNKKLEQTINSVWRAHLALLWKTEKWRISDQSMLWLMELILPGQCRSLLPLPHPLLSSVYMEVTADNVFSSLIRVPERHEGQWRVKSWTANHLQPERHCCWQCVDLDIQLSTVFHMSNLQWEVLTLSPTMRSSWIPFLCVVCMFSLFLCGFSSTSLALMGLFH